MPDLRITQIEKLIADYEAAGKDMTEANVEAAFVARLFASELERTLRETDAEIDRRVYDLYGLTEEERRVVEESVR